jgi:hypothetical protein
MNPEIEAGKLVTVRNTHTGDRPWIVELYAKRTPVLVIQTSIINRANCAILYEGQQRFIEKHRLKVVSG